MSGRLIDFRRPRWGHALHAGSWCATEKTERYGFWGLCKRKVVERTVLAHCDIDPEPGDRIFYEAVGHVLRVAPILRVEWRLNPRDMFKLYLGDSDRVGRDIASDALVVERTGEVLVTWLQEALTPIRLSLRTPAEAAE